MIQIKNNIKKYIKLEKSISNQNINYTNKINQINRRNSNNLQHNYAKDFSQQNVLNDNILININKNTLFTKYVNGYFLFI